MNGNHGTTEEIPLMWRNRADKVTDQLYQIGVKLAFITESTMFHGPAGIEHTEAGINGLWHLLNNVQQDVLKAGGELSAMRKEQQAEQ